MELSSELSEYLRFYLEAEELINSTPSLRLEDRKVKIMDIDAHSEDELNLAQIFTAFREMEMEKRPIPDYMETVQTQIHPQSRALCVDLIIEAAGIIPCNDSTVHAAVSLLDRYLSGNNVDFKNLCCLALTTLMIASPCHIHGAVVCDKNYYAYKYLCEGMMISGPELATSSARVIRYLEDDILYPTAYTFLHRFVLAAQCGPPLRNLENMALYVADVSLLSTTMLPFLPSMVAASSVLVAHYVLDPADTQPWNATLRHYTAYEACDLRDCVSVLLDLFSDCTNFIELVVKEVRNKFRKKTLPQSGEFFVDLNFRLDLNNVFVVGSHDHRPTVPAADSSIGLLEKCGVDCVSWCCICMEEWGGDAALRMPCSHVFHGRCIKKWLQTSHYCPLCCYEMPTD